MTPLTSEQATAVGEPGDVLLIACPGSGKTRTLVHRLARELLEIKSSGRFVIALTYTHIAADQIKDRLHDMGVDTSRLWVGTIHSFCLNWILRPYVIYSADLSPDFRVVDTIDSETLLDELAKSTPPLKSRFDVDFFAAINGLQISPSVKPEHRRAAAAVISTYEKRLRDNNQTDFEMILQYSWNLLAQRPRIARRLGQLFSLVAVDEYQDTRLIQYRILAAIAQGSESTRFFFVGDPNQAIFESLGGVALSKSELDKLTGRAFCQLPLTWNYRNSRQLISYFQRFAVSPQPLIATGPEKDHIGDLVHDISVSKDDLVKILARVIRDNVGRKLVAPHQICIVAPWWIHLASLTRALVQEMPEFTFNGPGLSPFGQNLDNFWYKVARLALTKAAPDLFSARLRWANELLVDMADAGVDVTELDARTLLRTLNGIKVDADSGSKFLAGYFEKFVAALPFALMTSGQMTDQRFAFFERMNARITQLRDREGAKVDSLESFKKVFRPKEGIVVSTIHGVKGAEYDTVIAFGLLEGIVPHFSERGPAKDRTAKRLLYVLCSRARKNLYLISEKGRGNQWYPKVQSEVLAREAAYPYTSSSV